MQPFKRWLGRSAAGLLVTLFAIPLQPSDRASEGDPCEADADCNKGLVCTSIGRCTREDMEEIVVTAPSPSPPTRLYLRPAPPPSLSGPPVFPVLVIPSNAYDQDGDSRIDCWKLLAGNKSARISSPIGYRTHPLTGKRKYHNGIDIAVPTGTIVRAAQSGSVYRTFGGNDIGEGTGNGNFVRINYADGTQGVYAHLYRIRVTEGARVEPGKIIASSDDTGDSAGPHLHYSIWKKQNHAGLSPQDPKNFYNPQQRYGSNCN